MTRSHALVAAAGLVVGLAGLLLWDRWGAQVWLDAAIAYCF
ncbi:hypothetical protein ACFOMD_06435 [Sphingoaurantiacus capsulatus]|uniref:Uncharacterized protein n=1 Tax=Sphingoaurantiacus capsulatus TaxID=1771310 RepID=A0ABV7XAD6_9SPHN